MVHELRCVEVGRLEAPLAGKLGLIHIVRRIGVLALAEVVERERPDGVGELHKAQQARADLDMAQAQRVGWAEGAHRAQGEDAAEVERASHPSRAGRHDREAAEGPGAAAAADAEDVAQGAVDRAVGAEHEGGGAVEGVEEAREVFGGDAALLPERVGEGCAGRFVEVGEREDLFAPDEVGVRGAGLLAGVAVEAEDPGGEGTDLRRGGLDAVEVGIEGLPERVLPGRGADPHLVEGKFDGVVEGEVPRAR